MRIVVSILLLAFTASAYSACLLPTPTCTDCNAPIGQMGVPYTSDIYPKQVGEFSKITSITGTVPPGMTVSISAPTGSTSCGAKTRTLQLTGAPTQAGTFSFCYRAENGQACESIDFIPGGSAYNGCVTKKIEVAGCKYGADAKSGSGAAYIPIPVDKSSTLILPVCAHCPKDPGPAGDTTIHGISTAVPGVRDDVYIAVQKAYPKNARARVVVLQQAKSWQTIIENSTNAAIIADSWENIIAWNRCLFWATGNPYVDGDDLLRPVTLTTYDRSAAYIQAGETARSARTEMRRGANTVTKSVVCP